MKRFVCLLLSLILACSFLPLVSFAAAEPAPKTPTPEDPLPFILIRGMDFGGLLENPGTPQEETALKSFDFKSSIGNIWDALFKGLFRRDYDRFADEIIAVVDSLMGKMACLPDGSPKYPTGVITYDAALSNFPDYVETLGDGAEEGFMKHAIEEYGADRVYYFNYDWRLDPFQHAQRLQQLIETAKRDSGKDKVNLACCSMGGILTTAYLTKYGAESLHRVVFISSTFCGTYVTGDLLNGRVQIYGDLLYEFIVTRMNTNRVLSFLLKVLNGMGLFKGVASLLNRLVPKIKDHVFDSYMRDVFGTMPSVWALTQPEDLDGALEYIFGGKEEEYAPIISLAKQYKEMNLGRDAMLKRMQREGLEIIVTASYGLPVVPVYERANQQGDTVLETAPMLGNAVVAPMGEKLPQDYVPADPRRVSPDNEVDLSPALFPETTWVVKGAPHVYTSCNTDCQEMLFFFLNEETCPIVDTNPRYPQFMQSSPQLELRPFS